MKIRTFLLLLIVTLGAYSQRVTQTPTASKANGQNSSIELKGNNNSIRVIQGNNITVYDLRDETQNQKFFRYLETLPGIKQDIKSFLQYNKKTLNVINRIVDDGVLNTAKFIETIEKYVRENEQLKIENEKLLKLTADPEFAKVLDEAAKKLAVYDNEGYQQTLEAFKTQKRNKIKQAEKELSNACYLQAKNSFNNYNSEKALVQINEALDYEKTNSNYILVKAHILFSIPRFDESLITYYHILNTATNDTTKSLVYNNVGLIYYEKAEYSKAMECFMKALPIREKLSGKESVSTLMIYNNIGLTYCELAQFDKAMEYYQKALSIQEVKNEGDGLGMSYNNIGTVYTYKADYTKALEYYQKALDFFLKKYENENPGAATCYNNIGSLYNKLGNHDKALEFHKKSLDISEKVFGKEHPKTAMAYNNMATAHYYLNDKEKALNYLNIALTIQEKVLGKQHTATATTYNNFGLFYSEAGQYDKALIYYNKALLINEDALGKDHPFLRTFYNNIGAIYEDKNEFDKALEYYKKALEINQKVFGEEHIKISNSYNLIGIVYRKNGLYDKALEYLNKDLIMCKKLYGEEHEIIQDVLVDIAIVYLLKSDNKNAENYFTKSKYSNYNIGYILNRVGIDNFNLNKYPESIKLYLGALNSISNMEETETNKLRIIIYQNLAKAHCYNGNKKEAIDTFEKALQLSKSFSEKEIDVERIKKNYEECKGK